MRLSRFLHVLNEARDTNTYPDKAWFGAAKFISEYRNELNRWIATAANGTGDDYDPAYEILTRIQTDLGYRFRGFEKAMEILPNLDLTKYIKPRELAVFREEETDWEGNSNILIEPKRKEQGWVIHFTNQPEAIAEQGFLHGASQNELGVTRVTGGPTWGDHRGATNSPPGWNFGVPLKTKADWGMAEYLADHGGYGNGAVLFQIKYTRIVHHGDKDQQALFWGPDIRVGSMIVLNKYGSGLWEIEGHSPMSFEDTLRTAMGGLTEAIRSVKIAPGWREPFRMPLLVNPSPIELDRIVGGASRQDVRVMLCDGRLYAWDANYCGHNEVIQELGMNAQLVDGSIRTAIMHVAPDAIMFSHFDVASGFLKSKNDPYANPDDLKLGFSPEDQRWWLAQEPVRRMLANYPLGESLNESWTHGIIHNPSLNSVMNLIQAVPGHIVKGLIDPKTKETWLASGYHHTHAGIVEKIGIDDAELCPFVISASTRNPDRFGIILMPATNASWRAEHVDTTNTAPDRLKQHWFFQLPWIARLNWADAKDHSWNAAWR